MFNPNCRVQFVQLSVSVVTVIQSFGKALVREKKTMGSRVKEEKKRCRSPSPQAICNQTPEKEKRIQGELVLKSDILHLFLQPIPQFLAQLRILRFLPALALPSPRDEELPVPIGSLRRSSCTQLRQSTQRSRVQYCVLKAWRELTLSAGEAIAGSCLQRSSFEYQ